MFFPFHVLTPQFGWTHLAILAIVVQSHFVIQNIYAGLFWSVTHRHRQTQTQTCARTYTDRDRHPNTHTQTHIAILAIVVQSQFVIQNIYAGLFWSVTHIHTYTQTHTRTQTQTVLTP